MNPFRSSTSLLLVVVLSSTAASAQRARPSQRATLTQTIGDTELAIRYFRPVARGRVLFGDLVKWGQTWTPGADSATVLEVRDSVVVGGRSLQGGRYSVWLIPSDDGPSTLILSGASDVYHRPYPEGQDVIRIEVEAKQGFHMETLAFYLPVVGRDSAVMNMHWGTTIVEIPLSLN